MLAFLSLNPAEVTKHISHQKLPFSRWVDPQRPPILLLVHNFHMLFLSLHTSPDNITLCIAVTVGTEALWAVLARFQLSWCFELPFLSDCILFYLLYFLFKICH